MQYLGRIRIVFILIIALLTLSALMPLPLDDQDQILVWQADFQRPGVQTADRPGKLGFLAEDGSFSPLLDVPQGGNRVALCGQNALSPDGETLALMMGFDQSNQGIPIYLMQNTSMPQQIDQIQAVGCLGGNGRFSYSPNSERFAYIAYEQQYASRNFPAGTLKIRSLETPTENLFDEDDVVAFDISDEGVLYTVFLTDPITQQANEAILYWWDGEDDDEILSFEPQEGCGYGSSYIKIGPQSNWIMLSETCGGNSDWQLFQLEKDSDKGLLAIEADPARLVPGAETNNIFFSTDNSHMFYTHPSGTGQSQVNLFRAPLDGLSNSTLLLEDNAVMPSLNGQIPAPKVSPDGNKMAVVMNDVQARSQILAVIDLSDTAAAPFFHPVAEAGEEITFFEWLPDSNSLVYIAGAQISPDNDNENAVWTLDLSTDEDDRIERGRCTGWAYLSPNGKDLAVATWQDPGEDRPLASHYLDLLVINLETGDEILLYGGEVPADDGVELRFAVPIYWMR